MVKQILWMLLLSIMASQSFAVAFEASVDRTNIGEGESLMLTLRYNSNVFAGEPDLTPLEQQFTIINQQRKNSFQYINGKSESWTIWSVALSPKRKGNLVIPSISYEGEQTKPIQINVSKLDPSLQKQNKDVFFHTETDVKTSYVQGQIVYSEKLYFSVPLDNSQLNEVEVEDAVVQPLGETKQYRTQLNGRSFDVFERRFVIFAQTSGELIIPGPRYTGEISKGRWQPGRPISVSQPPIRIQVLPQPADYPQQATWLPAKDLSLDYTWLGDIQSLKQGEPITLSLTLTALGLSPAQLPKIELTEVNGLKYYPEQPQTNELSNDSGVTGVVSQNIAVVVTKTGEVRLPEIRIPWFNLSSKRIEYAVMPSQILSVAQSTQQASTTNPQPVASNTPLNADTSQESPIAVASDSHSDTNFWPVVSLIFMLLWILTSFLLWRKYQVSEQSDDTHQDQHRLSGHLKEVKKACRANDAKHARQAIIAWAQTQLDSSIITLDHVARLKQDNALKQALQELDYTLYSPQGNSAWQGEYLWQLIKNIQPDDQRNNGVLKPLYPNESA